jgi:hypothetical protein
MSQISDATRAQLEQAFGTPAVDCDGKSALFNATSRVVLPMREISQISRQTRQVVEFNLHGPGATAQIGDRVYVFGTDGTWHRQQHLAGK